MLRGVFLKPNSKLKTNNISCIRPKFKIDENSKHIIENTKDWSEIARKLKVQNFEDFKNYWMNLNQNPGCKKFYKNLKSILKYGNKSYIVKSITQNSTILPDDKSNLQILLISAVKKISPTERWIFK